MTDTSRRTPKQARSRAKVAAITLAARRILDTEGVGALNTNRIADEAGVGVGTVYEYFPNKQAIAEALRDQLAAEETAAVAAELAAAGGLSLADAISSVVTATFALYRKNHAVLLGLQGLGAGAGPFGARPGETVLLDAVRERLRVERDLGNVSASDPDLAAEMVARIVESLCAALCTDAAERWGEPVCVAEITRAVEGYLAVRRR